MTPVVRNFGLLSRRRVLQRRGWRRLRCPIGTLPSGADVLDGSAGVRLMFDGVMFVVGGPPWTDRVDRNQ